MDYLTLDEEQGHEKLIDQHSENCFLSSNNELTITRIDGQRYSTTLFRPTDDHHMDIVVTQGTYRDSPDNILVTPSPKKKKTVKGRILSNLAKAFVVLILILLLAMMCMVIASVVHRVSHGAATLQHAANNINFDHVDVHYVNNDTMLGNFTSGYYIVNHTSSILSASTVTVRLFP
ncbi:uncharacterized protein LOC128212506 [Mya arenaria]|uniref:uncharacterized protein LOC128212506 n=1 Tax=Mya arenaria TaxID=6604 RepID=UPI0022E839DF|nr:uncharacterized protein LOC128212506 [Mya arenaria]XP_052773951.1 uncharacterized protein LOC128212506 [Mya arenaria]